MSPHSTADKQVCFLIVC